MCAMVVNRVLDVEKKDILIMLEKPDDRFYESLKVIRGLANSTFLICYCNNFTIRHIFPPFFIF